MKAMHVIPTVRDEIILGSKIGRGGYASVYLGRHGDNDVAVKVYKGDGWSSWANECRILAQCRHKNIIQFYSARVYAMGDFMPKFAIVMQLALSDLGEFTSSLQLSHDTVRGISRQLFTALRYLHRRKIIHADVNINNILITGVDGEEINVVLSDFSCSFVAPTPDSTYVGTISYISPEAAAGEELTTATDIWSACLVTYRLLASKDLFLDSVDVGSDDEESIPLREYFIAYKGVLGPPPRSIYRKYRDIFDRRGRIYAEENSLYARSRGELQCVWNDIPILARDFILAGVRYLPQDRRCAARMLSHPWLRAAATRDT